MIELQGQGLCMASCQAVSVAAALPSKWQISHFGACNSCRRRWKQEMTAICAGRRVIGESVRSIKLLPTQRKRMLANKKRNNKHYNYIYANNKNNQQAKTVINSQVNLSKGQKVKNGVWAGDRTLQRIFSTYKKESNKLLYYRIYYIFIYLLITYSNLLLKKRIYYIFIYMYIYLYKV